MEGLRVAVRKVVLAKDISQEEKSRFINLLVKCFSTDHIDQILQEIQDNQNNDLKDIDSLPCNLG